MTDAPATTLETELARAATAMRRLTRPFALVGGLAVSIRGEVRFTRDVDFAVVAENDAVTERLASDFAAAGYEIVALIEHDDARRLSTVRLRSRARVHVDLLAASSGIEAELVADATPVDIPHIGPIPVARGEDLLATKILSMSDRRPQDLMDARGLLLANRDLDLASTRERLALIRDRGFARGHDLDARLDELLRSVARS